MASSERIHHLMSISGSEIYLRQVMDGFKQIQLQIAVDDEDVHSVMSDVLAQWTPESLIDRCIPFFEEEFTDEEVDDIIAFYESPAGQSMRDKMPGLMQKIQVMSEDWAKDLTREIEEKISHILDRR